MLTKEEKIELARVLEGDFKAFCQRLLTGFDVPFNTIHDKVIDVLVDASKQKKLILAPRGIGKTTLCKAKILDAILFRRKRYIVYIAVNQDAAIKQIDSIKNELLTNPLIRELFGDIRIDGTDSADGDFDNEFTKKSWVAFGHTLVVGIGCDQPIRGSNWRNYRPDLGVLDDVEKVKELHNEVSRTKTLNWLLSDVSECYDKIRKNLELCYIDTIKHFDAAPTHLMKMKSWHTVSVPICDENFNSLAPEFMTTEEIRDKMEELRIEGKLDIFYMEYLNTPRDPDNASFQPQFFRYFNPTGERYDFQGNHIPGKVDISKLEKVILVDPAKSTNPSSDFSASVVVGIDLNERAIYVLDVFSKRVAPDELYDAIFEQSLHFGVSYVGIEVNSLNLFITHPFEQEIKVRKMYHLQVVPLKPSSKKELRIAALIPYARRGYLYFNKSCSARLEEQLLTHGYSAFDDIADALAYIVPMMSIGGKFFFPELSPIENLLGYDNDDAIEAEYSILDNEEPIEWEYAV